MASNCLDFFFDNDSDAARFGDLIREFGLTELLDIDPFDCERGDFGVTVSTLSSCEACDLGFEPSDNSPAEDVAMEFVLEIIREYFAGEPTWA